MSQQDLYLQHYGVLGMHWGIRRYQNKDGSLTPAGKRHNLEILGKKVKETDSYDTMKSKLYDSVIKFKKTTPKKELDDIDFHYHMYRTGRIPGTEKYYKQKTNDEITKLVDEVIGSTKDKNLKDLYSQKKYDKIRYVIENEFLNNAIASFYIHQPSLKW